MFGFLRDLLQAANPAPVYVSAPLAAAPYDPALRLCAQAFVTAASAQSGLSFDEVWWRLYNLPLLSVSLLDSPAGWIALAQQMGVSPKLTVH